MTNPGIPMKAILTRTTRWLTPLVALALVLLTASAVQACPTCAKALSDGHGGDPVAGYFWSILFMLSMPPLIFSGLCTLFYLQVRKARRAAEAQQQAAHASVAESTRQERELAEV